MHVNSQKDFLEKCRKHLWDGFNETCQEALCSHHSWEKIYKPLVHENIVRECPLSNADFREMLAKSAKQAKRNRKLFK